MEVRNAVLASLLIDALAVAAILAPGAGTWTWVAAGIAMSVSAGLLVLAGLAWRWRSLDACAADHAAADDASAEPAARRALAG